MGVFFLRDLLGIQQPRQVTLPNNRWLRFALLQKYIFVWFVDESWINRESTLNQPLSLGEQLAGWIPINNDQIFMGDRVE